jgi:hypothetical protein
MTRVVVAAAVALIYTHYFHNTPSVTFQNYKERNNQETENKLLASAFCALRQPPPFLCQNRGGAIKLKRQMILEEWGGWKAAKKIVWIAEVGMEREDGRRESNA